MDTRGGDSSHQDTDRGTAVEFVYRPTAADFEEALRARARRSPAGRAQALMAPLVAAIAVFVFSALRDATLTVWIISLVLSVVIASWGTVRGLRVMARRMFSVVEPYGQCHMAADERGQHRRAGVLHHGLDGVPGVSGDAGALRAAGRRTRGRSRGLPKRGAQDPADVDRLRVILDRNLKRLQTATGTPAAQAGRPRIEYSFVSPRSCPGTWPGNRRIGRCPRTIPSWDRRVRTAFGCRSGS